VSKRYHGLAIDILKGSVHDLAHQIAGKEAQITNCVNELEELNRMQTQLIDSIKHLGVNNVNDEQPTQPEPIPDTNGSGESAPTGQS
jgi:hypothetical protein